MIKYFPILSRTKEKIKTYLTLCVCVCVRVCVCVCVCVVFKIICQIFPSCKYPFLF